MPCTNAAPIRHLAYARLGEHRAGRRVFLETSRLADCGFAPEAAFRVSFMTGRIRLVADPRGDRRVSKKRKGDRLLPVIDISGRQVEEIFPGAERVRVVYRPGLVEIDLHPAVVAIADREERLRRGAKERKVAAAELCSGLGVLGHAMHEGLRRAGIEARTRYAVELDADTMEAALANNPTVRRATTIVGSLDELDVNLLCPVDILAAGLPCTGASLSGRSKKGLRLPEDDPEVGHLFVPFLEIVKKSNPGVIVLENVLPYADAASMSVIRTVLDRAGYRLFELTLDGADYALEARKRLCMVAISKGVAPEGLRVKSFREHETLREILEPVPLSSDRWKEAAYLAAKEEADKAAGKGFRQQLVTPEATQVGTIGRGYAKWRSTEPRLKHPQNPKLTRLFTPTEHARIKGVPEGLIAGLCDTTAHELLGQSIVYPAFVAVFEALGRVLCTVGGRTPALARA